MWAPVAAACRRPCAFFLSAFHPEAPGLMTCLRECSSSSSSGGDRKAAECTVSAQLLLKRPMHARWPVLLSSNWMLLGNDQRTVCAHRRSHVWFFHHCILAACFPASHLCLSKLLQQCPPLPLLCADNKQLHSSADSASPKAKLIILKHTVPLKLIIVPASYCTWRRSSNRRKCTDFYVQSLHFWLLPVSVKLSCDSFLVKELQWFFS